jgi:hypothetical protein
MELDWKRLLSMLSPAAGIALGGDPTGMGAMGQGGLLGSLFGPGSDQAGAGMPTPPPAQPMPNLMEPKAPDTALPPQASKQETAQAMVQPAPPIPQAKPQMSLPEDPVTSPAMNPNESLFDDSPMTANEQANLNAVSTPGGPPLPGDFVKSLQSIKAPTAPETKIPGAAGIPGTNQNGMQDVLAFLLGKGIHGGDSQRPRPGLSALLGG